MSSKKKNTRVSFRNDQHSSTSAVDHYYIVYTQYLSFLCSRRWKQCLPGKTIFFEHFSRGKPGNVSSEVCPINPLGQSGEYNVGLPVERLLTWKRLMAFVKHNNRTYKKNSEKTKNVLLLLYVSKLEKTQNHK